jgi:hypothetical protein
LEASWAYTHISDGLFPSGRTDGNQAFQWTPLLEAAFQALMEAGLCSAPILAYPKPRERFLVDTDASYVEIGGVLSQIQDEQKQVISCYGKTLNNAEKHYFLTERELVAIVRALEHFHKYLYCKSSTCTLTILL